MGGREEDVGKPSGNRRATLSLRETELTVLPTLQVCPLLLFFFQGRLLWLHIAISLLFSAALGLAFHLSCPCVAKAKAT